MPDVTRIDLGKQGVMVIDCKQPYRGTLPARRWGAREALNVFNTEATRVRGPEQPPTSEAFGIAQRMAKRYTAAQMQELSRMFWLRFSEPIYHEPGTHVLRYFHSIRAQLERNLNR